MLKILEKTKALNLSVSPPSLAAERLSSLPCDEVLEINVLLQVHQLIAGQVLGEFLVKILVEFLVEVLVEVLVEILAL